MNRLFYILLLVLSITFSFTKTTCAQLHSEAFGDKGVKNVQINYAISDITYSATPPPGRIIIKGNAGNNGGNNGKQSEEELPIGKDYQFTDKNGFVWNVDEKGTIIQSGKQAEGGKSTASNTEGVTGGTAQTGTGTINSYTTEGINVVWDMAGSIYAYDNPKTLPSKIKEKYPTVKDNKGNAVYPVFKAIVNKQTDHIIAKISYKNDKPSDAKVVFKTLNGRKIEAQETAKDTYKLTLKGLFDYATEDVVAVLVPNDTTQKQQIIGSFKLVHLEPKTFKIKLVATDKVSKERLSELAEKAQAVYSKIGVTLDIEIDNDIFSIDNLVSGDKIETKPSGMGTYSNTQKSINSAYNKVSNDRYIIFVTEKESSTDELGYMRIGGQFGYVFNAGNGKKNTLAHELGHGLFKLEHPWERYKTVEGETNLLMDYTDGNILCQLDWDYINDPSLRSLWKELFQNKSEGEYNADVHLGITPSGNIIDYFTINDKIIKIIQIDIDKNIFTINEIKYKKNIYIWNKDKKAYISTSGELIKGNKDKNKNDDRVNLFSSRKDGCLYDYLVIDWSEADERPENLKNRIREKIIAKQKEGGKWTVSPLNVQSISCSTHFAREVLSRDREECSKKEYEADFKKIREHINKTSSKELVELLNASCLSAIRNLTFSELTTCLNKVVQQEKLPENSELAILRLMTAMKPENYADFYILLENDGNKLLKKLVERMHDVSPYFWTGNNYTNFIGALVTMYKKHPASIENRWPKEQDEYFTRIVNLKPIKYGKGEATEFKVSYSKRKNTGTYDDNTGNVVINEVYITTTATLGEKVNDATIEQKEEVVKLAELSPLDPIVLVLDSKPLPLVQTALDGSEELGNNTYVVPAIFLKYNNDKIRNDNIEKGIITTLDVATIAMSGGTALATKVPWVRRAWAMAEVVGAVSNIVVNTDSITDPNIKAIVVIYDGAMGVIGFKNLGKGGYQFVKNLPDKTKKLLQENKGVRSILTAKYVEWKTLTKNLDNLNDTEKQLIAKQEKAWKSLGIADKLGSIQRKIIYPSTKINGIPVVRVSLGNNGKIAIIGRRMPYVRKIAEDLKKLGKEVEIFEPKSAFGGRGYNNLEEIYADFNKIKSKYSNGVIPYDKLKETLWYKENERWVKWIKKKGYDIYDLGDNPGKFINSFDRQNVPDASAFYDMEKMEIFKNK